MRRFPEEKAQGGCAWVIGLAPIPSHSDDKSNDSCSTLHLEALQPAVPTSHVHYPAHQPNQHVSRRCSNWSPIRRRFHASYGFPCRTTGLGPTDSTVQRRQDR